MPVRPVCQFAAGKISIASQGMNVSHIGAIWRIFDVDDLMATLEAATTRATSKTGKRRGQRSDVGFVIDDKGRRIIDIDDGNCGSSEQATGT
ncbi:hypothetical protein A7Q26_12565 [Sphingobium sp. TCM1]|nr:hypothetical protein A7Q26_12565 [Sphingobium sp. TCM1]